MTYLVDDAVDRLDRQWIWQMLHEEAYWGTWRTRADVETQIDNAWRVIGIYDSDTGQQCGFARAVSDGVSFAYLADVIVDPGHRGAGLGKLIVRRMIDDGPGASFRWTLFTADAHGLYEQFGFQAPDQMAMVRPSAIA